MMGLALGYLKNMMRIFAVSDIHVDYEENSQWVAGLSFEEYTEDVLILAGDVSDSIARLSACFQQLTRKFRHVFFVPGNHELWVGKQGPECSLKKFDEVMSMAEACGVVTHHARVGSYTIAPLFSWYDYSFGEPNDYIKMAWMDFKRCRWPKELSHPRDISEYFLDLNRSGSLSLSANIQGEKLREGAKGERGEIGESSNIITFSHFLPRIDLMPDYIPAKVQELYPVLGSVEIDRALRQLKPKIHVYGHSHLNRDIEIDGVRYINNAFGYPGEERISRKRLLNILDVGA